MALIACPDCGEHISDMAPECPNCKRPEPGKSAQEISEEGNNAFWGLLWIGNAAITFWQLGFWWGVFSIPLGPFIWLFYAFYRLIKY